MELTLIQKKIYEIRGQRVMLDFDLAILYETEAKRLKEAVRRNYKRFPSDFMFELTKEEIESLRTQFASSKKRGGRRYMPYAFTEQGVAMLSVVLNSDKAIAMSIAIMRAFVELRRFTINYKDLGEKIIDISHRLDNHNEQLSHIYEAIENLLDKQVEQKIWEERGRIGYK